MASSCMDGHWQMGDCMSWGFVLAVFFVFFGLVLAVTFARVGHCMISSVARHRICTLTAM
jgi:hypothetical protein